MATSTRQDLSISDAEWQERINLAACYRLLALYGWDDVIYNHASVRVPGEPNMFLMKAHTLLYQEVTASNLVKVSMHADLDESSGVNRPGFTLHGGIYLARTDVHSAVHVHTQTGQAISILQCGLLMISQSAMRFYNRLGITPMRD
jgi:ribulose-5-phosphate 4-epimerase/fuculose-1-phosphate aldolase